MDALPTKCPVCGDEAWAPVVQEKTKKGFSFGKAAIGGMLLGPIGLFGGALGKKQHEFTYVCKKCGFSHTYIIK